MFGEDDPIQCCIQRFSIVNKSWVILKEDTWFTTFDAIVLPVGHILLKGSQVRDGDEISVVALYKPATNELLDVTVNGTLDLNSYLMKHGNKCFELIKGNTEEGDKLNRLICDFDSDKPTMVIAEATEDEKLAIISREFCPEFTLDKRKLGLVRMECEC